MDLMQSQDAGVQDAQEPKSGASVTRVVSEPGSSLFRCGEDITPESCKLLRSFLTADTPVKDVDRIAWISISQKCLQSVGIRNNPTLSRSRRRANGDDLDRFTLTQPAGQVRQGVLET